MTEITVWYLELSERPSFANEAPDGIEVNEARVKQHQFNRFLYELVGGPWQWTDKLEWSEAQWRDYAERDNLRTWVAWVDGSPAGYFELEKGSDGSVDLAYFGLAEMFIGRGFGGYFLSFAIDAAWNWGADRITVNTCTLDHPRALDNYRSRGFELVRTEVKAG